MHLTRKELRALPVHELVDLVESAYLVWRFSDHESALEGGAASTLERAAAELDRRRRRLVRGGCTCELCFQITEGWNS